MMQFFYVNRLLILVFVKLSCNHGLIVSLFVMSELKALRFSNALFVFSGSKIIGARHHADV